MIQIPRMPNTPHEIAHLIAARVKELRLRAGWKQTTLAQRAGIGVATLQRFEESGRTSVAHLLAICHALGRLAEFDALLLPPPAQSIDELLALAARPLPKRGRR